MTKQQSRTGPAGVMAWARRKGVVGLAVPLVVPVAGACLAACSSTSSSGNKTASPAVHQSSMPSKNSSKSPMTPIPSGSPSVSAAACKHVRALRGDLTSITHVTFNGRSATVITADLKSIQGHLTALKSEPALASDLKPLSTSVTDVQNAAKGVTSPPTPAQLKAVITALTSLKATAAPTIAKLKAACP